MKLTFCTVAMVLVLSLGLAVGKAQAALLSSEVSLSGGYYQTYSGQNRYPVFFYWNLSDQFFKGYDFYFDVGINNNLVDNTWGFYAYQAFINIPIGQGFEEAPYRRSRIQLGRQLLTEGFEFSLLDGIYAPYYWNATGGATVFAGANYALGSNLSDFSSKIAGAVLHQDVLQLHLKGGLISKNKIGQGSSHFAFASLNQDFENTWSKPSFAVKGQYNLSQRSLDQGLASLEFSLSKYLTLGGNWTQRGRNALDPADVFTIYRLFALSTVRSASAYATLKLGDDTRLSYTDRSAFYDTPGGNQTGREQELSASWLNARTTINPSLVHIGSYGGDYYGATLGMRMELKDRVSGIRGNVGAAKITKLNSMDSWAYDFQLGLEYKLASKVMALGMLEIQRNHIYEFDARMIAYLSYFLF